MRWSDERYVRLYTRDTIAWRCLPWQARALFPLILRKLDRAGLMPLDGHGARGLSVLLDMPAEVVEVGYPALLKDGCLQEIDGVIVCPNYIEAQEAAQSDPQRAREKRARDREIAAAAGVTKRDEVVTKRDGAETNREQTVTSCHEPSRAVTSCHSVPSRAVPSQEKDMATLAGSPSVPRFDFDALYARFPRKEGKREGMNACRRKIRTQGDYEAFAAAVDGYAAKVRAEGTERRYMLHWSTFVNGRWEDYVPGAPALLPDQPRPLIPATGGVVINLPRGI